AARDRRQPAARVAARDVGTPSRGRHDARGAARDRTAPRRPGGARGPRVHRAHRGPHPPHGQAGADGLRALSALGAWGVLQAWARLAWRPAGPAACWPGSLLVSMRPARDVVATQEGSG